MILKQKKISITNKKISWDYSEIPSDGENIILSTRLRTIADIKISVKKITDDIVSAAEIATPVAINGNYELTYPLEIRKQVQHINVERDKHCLLYTSPSPRDATLSRMPSSA